MTSEQKDAVATALAVITLGALERMEARCVARLEALERPLGVASTPRVPYTRDDIAALAAKFRTELEQQGAA